MDPYEWVDSNSLNVAMRGFLPVLRREGEDLQRRGAVGEWTVIEPGRAFSAIVVDSARHNVEILCEEFGNRLEWSGNCDCSEELLCEHIYACMKELLAMKSASIVRSLSAGTASPGEKHPGNPPPKPTSLKELLSAAVGRSLTKQEDQYIRQVQSVYQRCRLYRAISSWDLQELGIVYKPNSDLNDVSAWPSFPKTEHDFWLHVANAADAHGSGFPPFMKPITDVREVRQRLARWKREREIQEWRTTLKRQAEQGEDDRAIVQRDIDLRLVIDPDGPRLEFKRAAAPDFEMLRPTSYRNFRRSWEEGEATFALEAQWLWEAFLPILDYSIDCDWSRLNSNQLRIVSRLLRFGPLQSRIVTTTGKLLARPPEPARWHLLPAANDEDDYRFTLVQADGTPLPPILATFSGNPPLYLTATTLFCGPQNAPRILDPKRENRIPAPALETEGGVELITRLGLPPPPRLSSRVRHLPYAINIQCELRDNLSGGNAEDCVVTMKAEAPDGRCMVWTGYNWLDQTRPASTKGSHTGELITRYDSTRLAQARAALEMLQLKAAVGQGLVTRVTRKFPELFSAWLKSLPPDFNVALGGDLASLADGTVSGQVKLDVKEAEIDWFDLRVVLNVSDATLTKQEVQLLLKAKGGYVRLAGRGWRRLQFDLSESENEQLARLGLSARELSAEPQRLHALQLADDAAKTFLPEQQMQALHRRASEIKTRVTPELPDGLNVSLRPYQLEGFHFLSYLATNRFGGILADDMGLGKTVQTLAWLLWLRGQRDAGTAQGSPSAAENGTVQSVEGPSSSDAQAPASAAPMAKRLSLVVCPKSVMDNWRAEAARFAPGLRVKVWSAIDLDRLPSELSSADLHVLNYNQLRTLGESLVSIRWQAVILDEGQYIKNPNSQTAQVARALCAEHRLVLSGTPIENRLLDLWSLMAFVMPGVLGSRAQFARLFEPKGDPFARRRLASRVRPFLLRRTKGQVAKDLPDRIEEDLFCEMEGEQKALYRAELKRAQQLLLGIKTQKELAQQQFHFLVSLLRLRQICCHPRLHYASSSAPSAKTEALLEQLEPLMEEGQKVLVFSQFVELLDLLRPELEARQWPVFYLAGDTENRGELVSRFQSAPGAGVFLISLKAGGFGLNLTAASYVVLFDPWWNPAVENQAIDRTHRIGQVNKVIAYRLLIKDSIEEKIRELQKTKSALAQDVLGEERFGQSLSMEDLRFLFAD